MSLAVFSNTLVSGGNPVSPNTMNEETFKCSCEHCDGHLEVSVQNAGMTVECPHCSKLTRLIAPFAEPGNGGIRLSNATVGTADQAGIVTESLPDDASSASRHSAPGSKAKSSKAWLTYLGLTLVFVLASGYALLSLKTGHIRIERNDFYEEISRNEEPMRFYLAVAQRSLPAIMVGFLWIICTILGAIHLVKRALGRAKPEDSPFSSGEDCDTD